MLTLYVDQERWRSHLDSVVAAVPGLVPVAKGNGYGFGIRRLAELAQELGATTLAVGTYAEVGEALEHFDGDVLVLTPWRPFEARATYSDRLVHTVGRLEDLAGLSSASREGDVPCRVGGEEFAFILPETGKEEGLVFAERFRRRVESSVMAPDSLNPITVSIGLAAFPQDGRNPDEIVWVADEALYESKRAGRNRVTASPRKSDEVPAS